MLKNKTNIITLIIFIMTVIVFIVLSVFLDKNYWITFVISQLAVMFTIWSHILVKRISMKGKNIVFWLIGVKTILVTLLQAMLIPLMMWANSLFNGFSLFEGRNINGELFNIYVYVGVVSVEVLITNILIAIHTHLGGNTNANL